MKRHHHSRHVALRSIFRTLLRLSRDLERLNQDRGHFGSLFQKAMNHANQTTNFQRHVSSVDDLRNHVRQEFRMSASVTALSKKNK